MYQMLIKVGEPKIDVNGSFITFVVNVTEIEMDEEFDYAMCHKLAAKLFEVDKVQISKMTSKKLKVRYIFEHSDVKITVDVD